MKIKTEPASIRIKRLLEVLSAYSFNLFNIKGNDMTLSDFLSRIKADKFNPHEIIPISFDLLETYKKNISIAKVHNHN